METIKKALITILEYQLHYQKAAPIGTTSEIVAEWNRVWAEKQQELAVALRRHLDELKGIDPSLFVIIDPDSNKEAIESIATLIQDKVNVADITTNTRYVIAEVVVDLFKVVTAKQGAELAAAKRVLREANEIWQTLEPSTEIHYEEPLALAKELTELLAKHGGRNG